MRYIDVCLGLAENITVLGADGENSIIHQKHNAFPYVMLLLRVKHVEENKKTKKYNWTKKERNPSLYFS